MVIKCIFGSLQTSLVALLPNVSVLETKKFIEEMQKQEEDFLTLKQGKMPRDGDT